MCSKPGAYLFVGGVGGVISDFLSMSVSTVMSESEHSGVCVCVRVSETDSLERESLSLHVAQTQEFCP